MEWIGFIVLFGLGLWLFVMGLGACTSGRMFGGSAGVEWGIPAIGAAIIYAAFKFAPFTITIN